LISYAEKQELSGSQGHGILIMGEGVALVQKGVGALAAFLSLCDPAE
jgi:hypothetical protein